jgi:hypothetical protein
MANFAAVTAMTIGLVGHVRHPHELVIQVAKELHHL